MSDEDAKLLQAVRDWRPPTKLHPIAMQVWQIYEKHGLKMPPEGLQEIRDLLAAYGDDLKALAEALEGLSRFMLLAGEHHKDKKTAAQIADLMREYTHLFEPFWQRVGEALANVGAETSASFLEFLGSDAVTAKLAPLYGQEAPKGSVPLRNLAPPARPPPWAAKHKNK